MANESGSGSSQLPIVIVLVVVIVGALGFAVWNAWSPGERAQAAAQQAGSNPHPGGDTTPMPDHASIDYAELEKLDGHLETYGNGSKVMVVAAVPDAGGGCHGTAVSSLRSAAEKHPDEMKVVVVMIHTPAAMKAGFSCAGYTINGKQTLEYEGEDGTAHKVTFTKSSDMGSWSVKDLEKCVQDALDGKLPPAGTTSESQPEAVGPAAA